MKKRILNQRHEALQNKRIFSNDGVNIIPIINKHPKKSDVPRRVYNRYNPNMINISIVSWCDADNKTIKNWGDYWVRDGLENELSKMGYNVKVNPNLSDVTIYCCGGPYKYSGNRQKQLWYDNDSLKIAWVYSHPNRMPVEELEVYDYIFCASSKYIKRKLLAEFNLDNVIDKPLYACSNMVIGEFDKAKQNDILFIGNTKGSMKGGRRSVKALGETGLFEEYRTSVYGLRWNRFDYSYMHPYYRESYYPYSDLNDLYFNAKVNLIDFHNDMREWGFISAKLFDTVASGGLVVSESNAGIFEIFGKNIIQFDGVSELRDAITHYCGNESDRKEKTLAAKKICDDHTYKSVAKRFSKLIKKKIG